MKAMLFHTTKIAVDIIFIVGRILRDLPAPIDYEFVIVANFSYECQLPTLYGYYLYGLPKQSFMIH